MKKILISIISIILIILIIIFNLNYFDKEPKDFNEIQYQDLEDLSVVIDTEVLDDGSYFVLSASKEYDYLGTEKEGYILNANLENVYYYLTKYKSDHSIEYQKVIDYCVDEDSINTTFDPNDTHCFNHEMYSHFIVLDETNLILSSKHDLYTYSIELETLTRISHFDTSFWENRIFREIYDITKLDNQEGFIVVGVGEEYQKIRMGGKATIVKYTNDLDIDWINLMDYPASSFFTVAQVDKYHVIVSGLRGIKSNPEMSGFDSNIGILVKYDIKGNLYWTKETEQYTYSILKLDEEHALLVGRTEIKDSILTKGIPSNMASIEKIDFKNGKSIWKNYYSTKGYGYTFTDVILTEDSSIYVTGVSGRPNEHDHIMNATKPFIEGISLSMNASRDGIVVKFNQNGKPEWKADFDSLVINQIEHLNNGKVLLTGSRYSEGFEEKLKEEYRYYNYLELIGVKSILDIDELDHQNVKSLFRLNLHLIIMGVLALSIVGFYFFKKDKQRKNKC